MEKFRKENASLKAQLIAMEDEKATRRSSNASLTDKNEKAELEAEVETLNLRVMDLTLRIQEYDKLLDEQTLTSKKLEASEKKLQSLSQLQQNEQREHLMRIHTLEEKLAVSRDDQARIKRLEREVGELRKVVDGHGDHKGAIEDLRQQLKDRQLAFNDLEEIQEQTSALNESLSKEIEELKTEIRLLKDLYVDKEKKLIQHHSNMELKIKDKEAVIHSYEEENERMKAEIQNLQKMMRHPQRSDSHEAGSTIQENSFAFKKKEANPEVHQSSSGSEGHLNNSKLASIEEGLK